MGNCASHTTITNRNGRGSHEWSNVPPSAVKLIDIDGRIEEFNYQPVRASDILAQHSDSFLCSSESMLIGSRVPQIHWDEELQLGQIYFLMPISMSKAPLSLQDMCALAIKASAALSRDYSHAHRTKKPLRQRDASQFPVLAG